MRRPIPVRASRFRLAAAATSSERRRRMPPDSAAAQAGPAVEGPAELGGAVVAGGSADVAGGSADVVAQAALAVEATALRKADSSATAGRRTAFTAWCSSI